MNAILTHPTDLTWPSAIFLFPAWAIEAKSQAVLYTLTEHESQEPFQKWQKRWEWRIREELDYFEGAGSQ
jgi:hypothetical protein